VYPIQHHTLCVSEPYFENQHLKPQFFGIFDEFFQNAQIDPEIFASRSVAPKSKI
jgi:hypothetical protein